MIMRFQKQRYFRVLQEVDGFWDQQLQKKQILVTSRCLSLFVFLQLRCFDPGSIQGGPGGSQEHPKPCNEIHNWNNTNTNIGYSHCLLLPIIVTPVASVVDY